MTGKLLELKELAKLQGNMLTKDQVEELLEELKLTQSQAQFVYDYLKEMHIGVDETIAPEAYLQAEEINYLQMYLEELKELPEVSKGEREAIFLSAMAQDQDAMGKLTEIFLPDVVEIAKLYAGQGVLLEDLIGEGNVAVAAGVSMLGAAEDERDAEGMLARIVMDAMEELIEENQGIQKYDKKMCDKVNKVADKVKELSELLAKEVTIEELIEETGMSKKYILEACQLSGNRIEGLEKTDKMQA